MNFVAAMAPRDVEFTELNTIDKQLPMQPKQKEDHMQALQAVMCNLNMEAELQTTEVRGTDKGAGQTYTCKKKPRAQ